MSDIQTLDQQLCFGLYSASMAVNRAYKPLLDRLGLTYPQFLVLSSLWEEDGRSIGGIAERLGLEPSTITPLIRRLEISGAVARRRNKADGRQVFIFLTKVGSDLQEKSRCLGETLMAASRMELQALAELNERLRVFRASVETHVREQAEH